MNDAKYSAQWILCDGEPADLAQGATLISYTATPFLIAGLLSLYPVLWLDIIIGLTIVAIGTSLPELAATVGSALKGHTDIAIGNVVGSNILNILAVLAVPSLVDPILIENVWLWRDGGMMLALTLLLAVFAYAVGSQPVITRFEGTVMLCAWVGYNLLLVSQAQLG